MVRGPCRGNSCDYWARVRIRKASIDELIADIQESVKKCKSTDSMKLDEALRNYWSQKGIRDFDRVCREEPDLCTKMIDAEVRAQI
jgi:hypothetical protein